MSPCVYHHLIIIIFLIKIIIKIFIHSDNITQESTYLGPLREYHFHLYHLHLITVISAIWSLSSSSPNHHPRWRPRTAVHLSLALEGLAALPMLHSCALVYNAMLHSCALVYTGPYCSAECLRAVQCNILIPYTTLQCTSMHFNAKQCNALKYCTVISLLPLPSIATTALHSSCSSS